MRQAALPCDVAVQRPCSVQYDLKTIKVDVRLITATNRDLEQEIKNGNFREDLYYRLNVVPLQIPPLRRRIGDIPLLVTHIIKKFNERLKKSITGIADDALAALEAHQWPGNIRELENVLERTILFTKGERIERADLQLTSTPPDMINPPRTTTPNDVTNASGAMPIVEDSDGDVSGSLKDAVRAETARVERELIVKALDETGGNVTQAARLLKISRKSLQMKMKELGLRDKEG